MRVPSSGLHIGITCPVHTVVVRTWLVGVAGPACVAVGALLAPVAWATFSVPEPPSQAIDATVIIDPAGYHPPLPGTGTPTGHPARTGSPSGRAKPTGGALPAPTAIGAATSAGSDTSAATDPGAATSTPADPPPAQTTSVPAAPATAPLPPVGQQPTTGQSSTGPQVVTANPIREIGDGESSSHRSPTATSSPTRSANPTRTTEAGDSRDGG